jgi:hypothetical protein
MNDRTNDRMIGRTNDRNFGNITAEQRLFGRTNGRTMNRDYERTMNRNYERTDERSNDRSNERSEFRQHNGWTKIIWINERTNDQTNGWTNHERSDERTNKLRTGGRMIEEQSNDPVLVCACVGGVVGMWGGRRVAMKWLGVAWEEALAPLFIGSVGGLVGGGED